MPLDPLTRPTKLIQQGTTCWAVDNLTQLLHTTETAYSEVQRSASVQWRVDALTSLLQHPRPLDYMLHQDLNASAAISRQQCCCSLDSSLDSSRQILLPD
ncbi:hypothetical protein HaLaN_22507 [Haematococcus lacustris]|uniref:Uncharacterized protein n=1 Tax=Haematococcus lacustris TaxID=44745 RepID=A0A699ZPA8_HAELA|nr:hypothetical protein HaLaN_22507 [Haematococcus lacustris]